VAVSVKNIHQRSKHLNNLIDTKTHTSCSCNTIGSLQSNAPDNSRSNACDLSSKLTFHQLEM